MATQAEVRRMVDELLALQPQNDPRLPPLRISPNAPRIVPRAPDLQVESDEVVSERARRRPPLPQWWIDQQREYNRRVPPYGNPNLRGPLPGERPADEVPYEDPWTGPALAPRR